MICPFDITMVYDCNNWFGLSHVESFNPLGIHAWHYLAATQIDATTLPLHDLPQTLSQ